MKFLTPETLPDVMFKDAAERYHRYERLHQRVERFCAADPSLFKYGQLTLSLFKDARNHLTEAIMAREETLKGFDLRSVYHSDQTPRGVRVGRKLYLLVDEEDEQHDHDYMKLVVMKISRATELAIREGRIDDLTPEGQREDDEPEAAADGPEPEEGGEDANP